MLTKDETAALLLIELAAIAAAAAKNITERHKPLADLLQRLAENIEVGEQPDCQLVKEETENSDLLEKMEEASKALDELLASLSTK